MLGIQISINSQLCVQLLGHLFELRAEHIHVPTVAANATERPVVPSSVASSQLAPRAIRLRARSACRLLAL